MTHQLENSEQVLAHNHPADQCFGDNCTIHNMSDHPLRSLEQHWNGEFMERISPSGEVWQDPDSPHLQTGPNAARCLDCGNLLYSQTRHDFKTCECGNLSVDGGSAYTRRGFRDTARIQEITSWPVPAGWR